MSVLLQFSFYDFKNCKLILALNKNSIDRLQRIQLKKNGVGKQNIKKKMIIFLLPSVWKVKLFF
jgi:hypothetical protein